MGMWNSRSDIVKERINELGNGVEEITQIEAQRYKEMENI